MIRGFRQFVEARMRGIDGRTGELFSYVDLEKRVPAKHPLRLVRCVVNEVLAALDSDFSKAYADSGRPSIAPERLLRALLLQAFYTIRSERQLMEQLDYNLLYRWFVGLGVDEPVWVATVFTKNRDRVLEADVARKFLAPLMEHPKLRGLLSDEHFSVDGTQIVAWASMKSFKAKDGSGDPPGPGRNGERDFHGEKPSNATHASSTDPEAQLYRKGRGKEAKLSFMGHALMENRSGLVVAAMVTKATGTAEREAAEAMIVHHSPGARRITLGADKGYDAAAFVADCPHHPASRLHGEPAEAKAHRGAVRLGQDNRRACPAHAARGCALTVQVHSDNGSLQPHPAAQVARGVVVISGDCLNWNRPRPTQRSPAGIECDSGSPRAVGTNFSDLPACTYRIQDRDH